MKNRERKATHIANTIKDIFKDIDERGAAGPQKGSVLLAWERAVGQKGAQHSEPASLKNKVLTINVDSSVWIYQFRLKEKDILKKLNRTLKEHPIETIRFRSGEIKR